MSALPLSFYARNKQSTNKNVSIRKECLKDLSVYLDTEEDVEISNVIFREDYDISLFHSQIVNRITRDLHGAEFTKRRIEILEANKKIAKNHLDSCQIETKIVKLKKEYNLLGDPTRLERYRSEAQPFLQRYAILRKKPNINYGPRVKTLYSPTQEDLNRIACIIGYLEIAKNYCKFEYRCTGYTKEIPWNLCENCEADLSRCAMEKSGIVICPRCSEQKMLQSNGHFDVAGGCTSGVNTIKDNGNSIIKALSEFQGLTLPKGNHEIMAEELDAYFQSLRLPSAEEIRSFPLLPNGKKKGTSVMLMRQGMTATNYNRYYSSARFMCVYMWGWVLEDLSAIENEILEDDKLLEEGYNMIPVNVRCRTSSIPTQVRLFFHLRNRGVSCDRDDFKLPKAISKCNRLLEMACANCKTGKLHYTPL